MSALSKTVAYWWRERKVPKLRHAVEDATGLLFAHYRWNDGPKVFLAVGEVEGFSQTILEIGIAGRHFCVWRTPRR